MQMSNTARDPNGEGPRDSKLQSGVPSTATSDISSIEKAKAEVGNFSIVVGGPVYDFMLRIGLVRLGLPNVKRRVIAFVVLAWLPLLLLSMKDGFAIGNRVTIPLLLDFSTYGRILLALPVLLVAEVIIDPAIRSAVGEFVAEGIVHEKDVPAFAEVLHRVQRWRDSAVPELTLLVLAFFPTFLFQHEWKPGVVSSWHSAAQGLTAAGLWYVAISAPLLRFVLYRWTYRYFIWTLLLWRISRFRLHLMPGHPDHAAGLTFLSRAQSCFGVLFCALGCGFAGYMANSLIHEGAPLTSFKAVIPVFLGLSVVLGICPLVALAPKMAQIRQIGLREYARLGNRYNEAFDRKWVHFAEPPAEPLLGTADIQSLADLDNSYAAVQQMSIAPITKILVVQFAVLAGAPLIPIVIYATPAPEIVKAILKMVA
jgi:hypothetical protein